MTEPAASEPLLDTHQHLVYRGRFGYAWTEDVAALSAGNFTLDRYRDAAADAVIDKTLFMETGVDDDDWQEETRFALSLAADPENRIAGVIAGCRPEADAGSFDAWLDELALTAVVGFRRILHVAPDDLSTSPQFRRNLRQLGKHGKTFDLCFLERQLPVALALAQSCDNTRLVLDHCGVPDIAGGDAASWQDGIRRLAALPHVSCKLSGVIAYCPPGRDPLATVRPYVEFCIEAFGWERVVWGSDWPVCNVTAKLATWASIFREILAEETADNRRAVCRDNAMEIYNLVD